MGFFGDILGAVAPALGGYFGGPVGGMIGSGVSGAIAGNSQRSANAANLATTNAQMAFQEQMSSSSYQRAVADMKAAGLSPMLAYSQGGASTPGGASTSAIKPTSSQSIPAQLATAEIGKLKADTDLSSAQAAESRARVPTYSASADLSRGQLARVDSEIQRNLAGVGLDAAQVKRISAEIPNLVLGGGEIKARTSEALARAGLTMAQISEVAPRIAHTIAQAENINYQLPVSKLKGDVAGSVDYGGFTKFLNSAGSSLGSKLFDLNNFSFKRPTRAFSRNVSVGKIKGVSK